MIDLNIDKNTQEVIDELIYSDEHRINSINHLNKIFSNAMSPNELHIFEWFKRYVISNESSVSKNYDIELTPYFKQVALDYLQNPKIKHINVLAPTGAGKSALFTALLNYQSIYSPSPTILCFQTLSEATSFCESRLYPTFQNNEKLAGIMPDKRNGQRKSNITFPTHQFWAIGASASQLQSKSCRYIIADEVFLYHKGMLRELLARHHDRPNRKVLFCSQGGEKYDDWHSEFEKGTVKEYSWTCPHCQACNPFKFDFLKWDKTLETIDAKANSTRLQCPECQEYIEDTIKNRRDLAKNGTYQIRGDDKNNGIVSYAVNALAMFRIPWAQLVNEFLTAVKEYKENVDNKPLIKFTQKRLAEFSGYSNQEEDELNANNQLNYVKPMIDKSYKLRNQFDENKIVKKFMCIDTQKYEHHWSIYNYLDDDKLYLVDCGTCNMTQDLYDIQTKYNIKSVFIDAAWNTLEVRKLCAKYGWIAVNATKKEYYEFVKGNKKHTKLYTSERHKIDDKVIRQFNYSSPCAKDTIHRLACEGRFIVPKDTPQTYIQQLKAEIKSARRDTDSNKMVRCWILRAKGSNFSHQLDNAACASIALLINGIQLFES